MGKDGRVTAIPVVSPQSTAIRAIRVTAIPGFSLIQRPIWSGKFGLHAHTSRRTVEVARAAGGVYPLAGLALAIRTVALGGRKAAPVEIAPAPLSFRALASKAKLFGAIALNFEHIHRQTSPNALPAWPLPWRAPTSANASAATCTHLGVPILGRAGDASLLSPPRWRVYPAALGTVVGPVLRNNIVSAVGRRRAVTITEVGRHWHDRHHYIIATITVRITVRPDKASWRSRIDLADSGTIWSPAGLVPFPRMELRLIGLGVCISAIGGGHARNEAGRSANRRSGKENRQCVFHIINLRTSWPRAPNRQNQRPVSELGLTQQGDLCSDGSLCGLRQFDQTDSCSRFRRQPSVKFAASWRGPLRADSGCSTIAFWAAGVRPADAFPAAPTDDRPRPGADLDGQPGTSEEPQKPAAGQCAGPVNIKQWISCAGRSA